MEIQPPVFVLSVERSGSTLLRYLLDTHPDIGAPGELALGVFSAHFMTILQRLPSLPMARDDESRHREIRRVVDGFMTAYLAQQGKRIWCDKSPINTSHWKTLGAVFPDARFICLYRTCRDTAYSCYMSSRNGAMQGHRRYVARHPGNFPRAMVEHWCDRTEELRAFEEKNHDRVVRVRYEDLVTAPDTEMARLMAFLGLTWDPALTARALSEPHSTGGGDFKILAERQIHTRSIGQGALLPMSMLPRSLVRRANALLATLEYAPLPLTRAGDDGAGHADTYLD